MYFNSLQYAAFLPIVFVVYYILPKKIRYLWLLAASYYFYMCWNAKYALLILAETAATYLGALAIEFIRERERESCRYNLDKFCLFAVITVNFGLLFYFKYINFFIDNLNYILKHFGSAGISAMDILLPVGISFFTFQATGYIIDVYRADIYAEKNFFRYALFVSFFPQLVAGPIERSKNLLKQLASPAELDGENIRVGLLYILFGLWQKVFVADNLAIVVNSVYDAYFDLLGVQILLATVLFAFEIYCDFGAYSNIAIGSARLFGIRLMRNFDSPYLACSVTEFWRRWHISLTTWFRDYLYIPLGGNRKGKARKCINTLIVFFASGVWHGAAWSFILWGTLNGIFIAIEDAFRKAGPAARSACEKWLRRLWTFILVDFTWLFFRAGSLPTALSLIKRAVTNVGLHNILYNICSVFSSAELAVIIIIGLLILLAVSLVKEKHGDVVALFFSQKEFIRWIVYFLLALMIILFGAYGDGYEQTEFIYFQF